jgi:hypothetical protein
VLFPTPKERVVEMVAPTRFVAKLQEPALATDPTSNQQSEQLPSYNAYSADGDVTGPLVYVNYGAPADYEVLERRGISVKGAIVIARYGQTWRGIKPKVAAEHGAVGCLIYSDPRNDGFAGGSVFPAGPMRPSTGVQRGSVADMPLYPGDPLTPGVGATKGAKRLALADAAQADAEDVALRLRADLDEQPAHVDEVERQLRLDDEVERGEVVQLAERVEDEIGDGNVGALRLHTDPLADDLRGELGGARDEGLERVDGHHGGELARQIAMELERRLAERGGGPAVRHGDSSS